MTRLRRFKMDKLGRDFAGDMIRAQGADVCDRIMEPEEYAQRLRDKLIEESNEAIAETTKDGMTEELADVLEVIYALGKTLGITPQEIEDARREKRHTKGGFDARLYCDYVTAPDNSPVTEHCLKNSDKYPEIEIVD